MIMTNSGTLFLSRNEHSYALLPLVVCLYCTGRHIFQESYAIIYREGIFRENWAMNLIIQFWEQHASWWIWLAHGLWIHLKISQMIHVRREVWLVRCANISKFAANFYREEYYCIEGIWRNRKPLRALKYRARLGQSTSYQLMDLPQSHLQNNSSLLNRYKPVSTLPPLSLHRQMFMSPTDAITSPCTQKLINIHRLPRRNAR